MALTSCLDASSVMIQSITATSGLFLACPPSCQPCPLPSIDLTPNKRSFPPANTSLLHRAGCARSIVQQHRFSPPNQPANFPLLPPFSRHASTFFIRPASCPQHSFENIKICTSTRAVSPPPIILDRNGNRTHTHMGRRKLSIAVHETPPHDQIFQQRSPPFLEQNSTTRL